MARNISAEGKVALWLGVILTVTSTLVLIGYGLYYFARDFLGSSDIPIAVRVAVPVAAAGILVLLGVVIADRMRRKRYEQFGEVEY